MTVLLKNNASGFLATSISASDTSILLTSGTGASFPNLGSGDYFYATITPTSGTSEIVKATARSGDALAIVRAQEGTVALSFAAGARVELRVTAQSVIDAINDRVALKDQASEISIDDAGGYYSGTNVEAALQEAAQATTTKYINSGTGAQSRTVQARLRDFVSVMDFIPAGTNTATTDCTAYIQAALNANATVGSQATVYVPRGTYRIDGCILLNQYNTLFVDGTLARLSAYSSSTRPVVRMQGSYVSLIGNGPAGSVILSQNASPDGVVLWGAEDPTTQYGAYRWATCRDLRIQASDTQNTSNKTLALQNSQFWIGGALYDGVFQNLHLFNGYQQVYLNPISNGNTFNNIFSWNCNGYMVYMDGVSGGLITDNNFANFMADGSPSQLVSYYGRYVNNCSFANCGGEPGGGNLWDLDSTCSSIAFHGWDNHSGRGTFPSPQTNNSSYMVQGSMQATYGTFPNLSNKYTSGGGEFGFGFPGTSFAGFTQTAKTGGTYGTYGVTELVVNSQPGSGTATSYFHFKGNNIGGSGVTKFGVAVDGPLYSLDGYFAQSNNTAPLGSASARFTEVFAVNGTINTSDEREKQQIEALDAAELAVARRLKALVKKFKFNHAVEKKGDDARIHVGVIAQEVRDAFAAEGLDAHRYGIFCYDKIYMLEGRAVSVNENGKHETWHFMKGNEEVFSADGSTPEGAVLVKREHDVEESDSYGVRYEELLAFIIAAL